MATGRIMSPEMSFSLVLRQAQDAASQGKTTITKTEAEKALQQLEGHPHADAAERARIVQGFLDGADSAALSPKAREALANFVSAQGQAGGGQKATELKLEAARTAGGATFHLNMARGHVARLLQQPLTSKAELTQVTKALDDAQKAIGDARQSLTGILKVADHAAKIADTELENAGAEIAKAKTDVKNIVARAKSGTVTKAQLTQIQDWLSAPKPEIEAARKELGLEVRATRKFPSDNEDGGGSLPGIGGAVTLKFPSDNEDGGSAGGGTVVSTMKAPSDGEDGGSSVDGPNIHPPKPEAKTIHSDRIDAMRAAFGEAKKVKWLNSMPLGQRFESQEFMREKHPDGFAFSVMVPVGALTPTAPRADPNTVNTFWIRRTGGFAGLTQYAGPFTIKETPKPTSTTIKPERMNAMRDVFNAAKNVKWHESLPLGSRFDSQELMREKHPDGFAFSVMVPVGALSPTAPHADPNTVDSFWIRRTGGIAGRTDYAGPFSLDHKVKTTG